MTTHETVSEDILDKVNMKSSVDQPGTPPCGSLAPSEQAQKLPKESPIDSCVTLGGRSPSEKDLCDSHGGDNSLYGARRKHRRKRRGGNHHNRKCKWKPYNKLTWDEKKELEERETVRATKKREDRFASGQPMAPYNTTQFLMEQHEPSDPEFIHEGEENNQNRTSKGEGSGSVDSSDEFYYDSPTNEDIFLEKEFTETYENYHAERLNSMSKEELVREYLELETKVEGLERQLRGSENSPPPKNELAQNDLHLDGRDQLSLGKGGQVGALPNDKQKNTLEMELQKLKTENARLSDENKKLRGER